MPDLLNSTFAAENAKAFKNYLDLADLGMCTVAMKDLVLLAKTHKMPKSYRDEICFLMQFLEEVNFHFQTFIDPESVDMQERIRNEKF